MSETMSNWRTERCECLTLIPVGEGVLQTVKGQTAIYICKPCAYRYLSAYKPTQDAGDETSPGAEDLPRVKAALKGYTP